MSVKTEYQYKFLSTIIAYKTRFEKKPVCTSLKIDRTCFATYLAGLCYTAATSYFISLGILDPITANVIWVQFMSVWLSSQSKVFFWKLPLFEERCVYSYN